MMDAKRLNEMRAMLAKHLSARFEELLRVLDVGAYDVNGTYRGALPPAWSYTGSDIRPGPNVDYVQPRPYRLHIESALFDVVISGSVMEHVDRPWRWMEGVYRVLKAGGWVFIAVPWRWEIHDHPSDYWRVLPEGLRVLFQDVDLEPVEIYTRDDFTYGAARKRYAPE